jgi:hypothetical protein
MNKTEWKSTQLRLQNLRTLIARASNTDDGMNEARNAALAFVRIVIKNNLVVLDPDLAAETFAPIIAKRRKRRDK